MPVASTFGESSSPTRRERGLVARGFSQVGSSLHFKSANVALGLEQHGIKTLDGSQETKKVETRRAGPEQQLLFRRLKFALPAHPPNVKSTEFSAEGLDLPWGPWGMVVKKREANP